MRHSDKSSSKPTASTTSFQFAAIGTEWHIAIQTPLSASRQTILERRILHRIARFDKAYSRFRSDSFVSLLAREGGTYPLPPDAKPLLDLYHRLYLSTDGAMTPLIGQTLVDAGYDARYGFTPHALTPPPAWEKVLSYTASQVSLQQPALLDFGAIGKGYLVDILAELLNTEQVTDYCINAGGDIRCQTSTGHTTTIGLEHPEDPTKAIGVAHLTTGSICGSAGNRRRWGNYHHIIDPHRLQSPKHLLAAWVSADTAMLADGLTTALFFRSARELQTQYTFEYALVHHDYQLEHSPQFPATFFSQGA